jgi:hypothetical protein
MSYTTTVSSDFTRNAEQSADLFRRNEMRRFALAVVLLMGTLAVAATAFQAGGHTIGHHLVGQVLHLAIW